MSTVCKAGCGDDLPVDGGYATCGMCNGHFHYTCGKTREQSWLSLSTQNKKRWNCPTCKVPIGNSGSSGTPTTTSEMQIHKKQQQEVTMENIEALLEKMLPKKLKELEDGITFVGTTVEEIKKDFKDMQRKMITMENRQDKLEQQNQELRKKVKDMEVFIQDLAQEKNGNKVEITGIPQDVDSKAFTEKIFKAAKVDHIVNSSEYFIEKTFKPRQAGSGPVVKSLVVGFQNKNRRDAVLEVLKRDKPRLSTKDISQEPPLHVYINEYLTPYMRRLFYEAKKVKNDKQYQYLWVKNGQILIKKNNDSKPMRLTSLEDLAKI